MTMKDYAFCTVRWVFERLNCMIAMLRVAANKRLEDCQ